LSISTPSPRDWEEQKRIMAENSENASNQLSTTDNEKIASTEENKTSRPSDDFEGSVENVELDAIKEKKLLAKLDLMFVPIIMFAYLTCFLDRSNIGMVSRSLEKM
jgi:hypothetical protein